MIFFECDDLRVNFHGRINPSFICFIWFPVLYLFLNTDLHGIWKSWVNFKEKFPKCNENKFLKLSSIILLFLDFQTKCFSFNFTTLFGLASDKFNCAISNNEKSFWENLNFKRKLQFSNSNTKPKKVSVQQFFWYFLWGKTWQKI
jgi:hypothetical protein